MSAINVHVVKVLPRIRDFSFFGMFTAGASGDTMFESRVIRLYFGFLRAYMLISSAYYPIS